MRAHARRDNRLPLCDAVNDSRLKDAWQAKGLAATVWKELVIDDNDNDEYAYDVDDDDP